MEHVTYGTHCMHAACILGADLHAQSVLSNKPPHLGVY